MGIGGGADLVSGGRTAGDAWVSDYTTHCYHQTCDTWSATWDLRGAAEDVDLFYRIGLELGQLATMASMVRRFRVQGGPRRQRLGTAVIAEVLCERSSLVRAPSTGSMAASLRERQHAQDTIAVCDARVQACATGQGERIRAVSREFDV
jgi:hypothetical protein